MDFRPIEQPGGQYRYSPPVKVNPKCFTPSSISPPSVFSIGFGSGFALGTLVVPQYTHKRQNTEMQSTEMDADTNKKQRLI
jgi:hypothetical protein